MRALVYQGPGRKAFREVPDPEITGQIDAKRFITHHFGLEEFDEAYDVFGRSGALKVILSRPEESMG